LIPQRNRIFRQRAAVRDLLFPLSTAGREEPSVMKLFIESGKDTNPDSITARLLLLTAAAVSLHRQVQNISIANHVACSASYIFHGDNARYL